MPRSIKEDLWNRKSFLFEDGQDFPRVFGCTLGSIKLLCPALIAQDLPNVKKDDHGVEGLARRILKLDVSEVKKAARKLTKSRKSGQRLSQDDYKLAGIRWKDWGAPKLEPEKVPYAVVDSEVQLMSGLELTRMFLDVILLKELKSSITMEALMQRLWESRGHLILDSSLVFPNTPKSKKYFLQSKLLSVPILTWKLFNFLSPLI